MEKANILFKDGTMIEDVSAIKIANHVYERDDIKDIYCPHCGAVAEYAAGKIKKAHFRATHNEECEIAKGKKTKKLIHNINYIIDISTMLNYHDKPGKQDTTHHPGPGGDGGGKKGGPEGQDDEVDISICNKEKHAKSVGLLYSLIQKEGANLSVGNNLTAKDILLTEDKVADLKRNKPNEAIILACLTRIAPSALSSNIEIPDGYFCLRDIYTSNFNKSIIFLINFESEETKLKFAKDLYGTKKENHTDKSNFKGIIIIAKWQKVSDETNLVYRATINSKEYKFTNQIVNN